MNPTKQAVAFYRARREGGNGHNEARLAALWYLRRKTLWSLPFAAGVLDTTLHNTRT